MSNTHMTYATATKKATEVTVSELAAMLVADDNPRIFPGKNRRGVIAMGAKHYDYLDNGRGSVIFDRCTFGTGHTTMGSVTVGFTFDRPVFEFEAADGTMTYVVAAAA
jgi:hypothetical protein